MKRYYGVFAIVVTAAAVLSAGSVSALPIPVLVTAGTAVLGGFWCRIGCASFSQIVHLLDDTTGKTYRPAGSSLYGGFSDAVDYVG